MTLQLSIICENTVGRPISACGEHGFACLVKTPAGSWLFDTGGGETLLANMSALEHDAHPDVVLVPFLELQVGVAGAEVVAGVPAGHGVDGVRAEITFLCGDLDCGADVGRHRARRNTEPEVRKGDRDPRSSAPRLRERGDARPHALR